MGSSLITGCGSTGFQTKRSIRVAKGYEDEEEQIDDMDDGGMIQNNRDNYFNKEDFERIARKFPEYKEWMKESMSSPLRLKSRQKINWKEGELIGHGSFGRVIMGLNAQTGSIMAVKQVQIGGSNSQSQQDRIKALEIEIDCLRHLSHKNIVQYYGSRKTKTTFNIFLEYISGGTIASLIEKYGPLNETLVRMYTRQILEGLEYLHTRNTVHRDIKGGNVLVDNNGVCKLADFGTAKRISAVADGENKYMPSIKGTANWMAPEVIKQTSLGRHSDIWSLGCTVLEMLTGKAPWSHIMKPGTPQLAALYHIANAKTHPPLPGGLSAEATDFLKQCFKIIPAERANVIKLLNHKFITGGEAIARTTFQSVDVEKLKAALNSQSPFPKVGRDSSQYIKTETNDKLETPVKEKEKFSFKKRMSFMRSQESSIYPTDILEELKKAEHLNPKEKDTKKQKQSRKVLALDISSMKRDEISQKPRFTIRTNETQNMSSNLDLSNFDEKPLRDLRTVSNPPQRSHNPERSHRSESKRRLETQQPLQESAIEYKKQGTTPIPSIIDYTDTVEVSISAKEPSPMPKNTPLSHRKPGHRQFRRSFRTLNSREEDFSSVNGSALVGISRMSSGIVNSPEVSSQHSRTRTFFNSRDMMMITKDLELTQDYKIEEQGIAETDGDDIEEDEQQEVKPKEKVADKNEDKFTKESETPVYNPPESARSYSKDSDLELSVIHEIQGKQSSASINTVQMSEGFQGGASSRHKKSTFSLKFTEAKDFSNPPEETPEKNDGQLDDSIGIDLGPDAPFRGIVLTESLDMGKPEIEEHSTSVEQVSVQKEIPNIESYMLTESIQLPKQMNDNWKKIREGSWRKRKHVLNNLFRTENSGGAY